jgi:hypothetical protein
MDDIIMLNHPDYQDEFEKLEQQLVKLYNLRQLGSVKWFLGICVERLVAIRQLYLVHGAFITKVSNLTAYVSWQAPARRRQSVSPSLERQLPHSRSLGIL